MILAAAWPGSSRGWGRSSSGPNMQQQTACFSTRYTQVEVYPNLGAIAAMSQFSRLNGVQPNLAYFSTVQEDFSRMLCSHSVCPCWAGRSLVGHLSEMPVI